MALLWGQHSFVWGRKVVHSQHRWRLPGILCTQWSSGYTIIRVCGHLTYYKPKYKHNFLKMCFLSVTEFWFRCEMPLQPRSMRHPLPVPFPLWAFPCEPFPLWFLQPTGPPWARSGGFHKAGPGLSLRPYVFPAPMSFFLWAHYSSLLWKVKTLLYPR